MSKRRSGRALGLAAAIAAVAAVTAPQAVHAADSPPAVAKPQADFNGDGYADVAVTAPIAKVSGHARAGYVAVVYGSANGLDTRHKQVISQDTAGIPGAAEYNDRYGASVAAGDLNGDGYTDLVVGSSGEDVGDVTDAGTLAVVWGGPRGLSGGTGIATGTAADRLDTGTAIGDFDADGHLDIATPDRVLHGPFDRTTGAASTTGLRLDGTAYLTAGLAAGDIDGDGDDDLVALVKDDTDYDFTNPDMYHRRVQYLEGGARGLGTPVTLKNADGKILRGGESLGIGDVDKDGHNDLVIGRTLDGDGPETIDDPLLEGGQIGVVYGSATGPDTSRTALVTQNTPGVPGVTEWGDGFGGGISVADTNRDGYADVATGAGGENVGDVADAGAVTVLRGSASGLTGTGAVSFNQNTPNVPGTAEQNDFFGTPALVDTNHDGRAELYVGGAGENRGDGAVWAFRSTGTGPTAAGSVTFGARTLGTVATEANLGDDFAR
ncbi:FG-GAP-like repeat-containing protein [Streptomyces sp. NPDC086549]|uniref:FG-GAP-like repeat-containing protein n=1 Tax=Streptomyces sp. NPDC086549 TaxID=3365752 RepID=UPI00380CF0B7